MTEQQAVDLLDRVTTDLRSTPAWWRGASAGAAVAAVATSSGPRPRLWRCSASSAPG